METYRFIDIEFTPKDNKSILLNFDKDIELNHLDYQVSCNKKYFNNVLQWMLEDIENSSFETKFIYIDNLYHYLMNNLEDIYDDKRFYIEKANYFLRKIYNYKDSIGFPLYDQTFNEMTFTIHNFLIKIDELECKKSIIKKELELAEFEKSLSKISWYRDVFIDGS
jgi:hypothetical protein